MARSPHVIFSGGGTLGHLMPGLAVAEQLVQQVPQIRITFAGGGAARERRLVEAAGFEYVALPCRPFTRQIRTLPRFVATYWWGARLASAHLRRHPADVVVGLGGYASVPMARAAGRCGVPLVLVEQNSIPSRANRWLARHASYVCAAFAGARRHFQIADEQFLLTGNPVRSFVAARATISRGNEKLLLVTGGSQGARQLNQHVPRLLAAAGQALIGWRVLHQTGTDDVDSTRAAYRSLNIDAEVVAFVDNLPERLAMADLAICRAGGTTLAELAVVGVPALLCPYPYAADDHQRRNAEEFIAAGACRMLELPHASAGTDAHFHDQADMLGKRGAGMLSKRGAGIPVCHIPNLESEISNLKSQISDSMPQIRDLTELLTNDQQRSTMALAMKALGRPAAARTIAGVIVTRCHMESHPVANPVGQTFLSAQ